MASSATFTKTIHRRAEGPTQPNNNFTANDIIVCVIGAGKGIGYHISISYAKAGAAGIVICSRSQPDLDSLGSELKRINPKLEVLSQTCDIANNDEITRLAEATKKRFNGRLDVCIANAGVFSKYLPGGTLPKSILEESDSAQVIDVNFLGTVRVAKQFVPLLLRGDLRTFVVITSIAAHLTSSEICPMAYNTSKIALCRLVEHLHNDHVKEGLLSHAVHPGAVITSQTVNHPGESWRNALTDDIDLCGGFLTWLTHERRNWLSGRYISSTWDVEELQQKRAEIVEKDLLKFRMSL